MNSIFQYNQYTLKRQVFALAGKFRLFAPNGQLVLFSEQKMFKMREDIRVYSDESKTQEVLMIKARQIVDFSAAYDVVDSAAGQINKGVKTTDVTLKNYAGVLEEARADLVGLYYTLDQKLVDIGVSPSLEVGKAEYDNYIMNGMMTQLQRIEPGDNLEEAHMRNRQLNSQWAFKKGEKDKVIERISRDGKTYFVINDYQKLRTLFGELLREIQRIKSEGDFTAGKNLVETYGVIVDQPLLKEVHARFEKLNIAPYMGFIQPKLVPVMEGDRIVDVKVQYPKSFVEQMLEYGKTYNFLAPYWN